MFGSRASLPRGRLPSAVTTFLQEQTHQSQYPIMSTSMISKSVSMTEASVMQTMSRVFFFVCAKLERPCPGGGAAVDGRMADRRVSVGSVSAFVSSCSKLVDSMKFRALQTRRETCKNQLKHNENCVKHYERMW